MERSEDVEQAIGQLRSLPGADAWVSITCTYHSPLQHLNEAIHGSEYSKKLQSQKTHNEDAGSCNSFSGTGH